MQRTDAACRAGCKAPGRHAPSVADLFSLAEEPMTSLAIVAIVILLILTLLWELGFDSVAASIGRGALKLITYGRFRFRTTGGAADTVVGALTIISLFLLILFLSGFF